MGAQLISLNEGPNIIIDKPILLLGRHRECDIQIESRKVSRRHCCLGKTSNQLFVRDLDSTNGIRINGMRVIEGVLASGDELTIGTHRFRIEFDRPIHPNREDIKKAGFKVGEKLEDSPNNALAVHPELAADPLREKNKIPAHANPGDDKKQADLIIPESIDLLPPDSYHPI